MSSQGVIEEAQAVVQKVIRESPGLEDDESPVLSASDVARATAAFVEDEEGDEAPRRTLESLFAKVGLAFADEWRRFVDKTPETLEAWLAAYAAVYAPARRYGSRLRKAAARNDATTLRDLVARGCDPRGTDGLGYTLLHAAAAAGHLECANAAVEVLTAAATESRFDVDARDRYGWTACVCAAANGHVRVVERLTQLGANWRAQTNEGRTALHWAAAKGRLDVVSLLLKKGGGSDLVDNAGMTPLHLAAQHGHVAVCAKLVKDSSAKAAGTANNILGMAPYADFQDTAFWLKAGAPVVSKGGK